MKFIDKLMDALNMYDEEEVFDEEELVEKKPLPAQEEEKKPRPSLFRKKTPAAEAPAVESVAKDNAPKEEKAPRKPIFSFKGAADKKAEPGKMSTRTMNLPVENKLVNVVVLEPVSFDDSQKVADHLRGSQPVVVNFGNTDNVVAKRMTDFISGTIYALGGSMKKLGRDILICAPKNVDIDADTDLYNERGEQLWKK